MRTLDELFAFRDYDRPDWVIGKIPKHFKRLSVPMETAIRLAKSGALEIAAAFDDKLFFCQSLIAGAILSPDYDKIVVVTPSQYGKSWLLGRIGIILAYRGEPVYIAGATASMTDIIMGQTRLAIQSANQEIKNALTEKKDVLESLSRSLSKKRIGFTNGGFEEPITLGDTYTDSLSTNKAVGRAGHTMVDEASLATDKALSETGRREFANIDGKVYKLIMISNPHKPGYFYDELTADEIDERTFVLWIDALTAVEEERFSEEQVRRSEFAKHKDTLYRYLLCQLNLLDTAMFDKPLIHEKTEEHEYSSWYLGIDAAYKGHDQLEYCLIQVTEDGMVMVEDIQSIDKSDWIDGITTSDIAKDFVRIIRAYRVPLTCVDIGQGIWLVDSLIKAGVNVRGEYFQSAPTKGRVKARHYAATNAMNLRAEMHLDLQDLIENKRISFQKDAWNKVKDIFPFVTATRKSNGKIKINEKSEIRASLGRSPDELDACILAIHAMYVFMGEGLSFD